MACKRIAILWTIVIVFISQLFHCAYTNNNNNNLQLQPVSTGQQQRFLSQQQQLQQLRPRYYSSPAALNQQLDQGISSADTNTQDANQNAAGEARDSAEEEQQQAAASGSGSGASGGGRLEDAEAASVRDRCRELISLTLMSFRDLSPDERASEELDCATLREQIAAAAGKSSSSQASRQRQQQQQQQHQQLAASSQVSSQQHLQQPLDDLPLAPPETGLQYPYSNRAGPRPQQSNQKRPAQVLTNSRQFHLSHPEPPAAATGNSSGWSPRASYLSEQMQQLLNAQRQHRLQLQQQQEYLRQQEQLETTLPPTTAATTFESLFETTLAPTTTTTTTTTTTPAPPKIRIGGGKRRPGSGRLRATSTTTTTTTTTTARPSTQADYADGSELSTDYYDEYDDQGQAQTTTTTTTTSRPHRGRSGRKRFRTTSTSPKPSTTSTTLSPGYQPRPDGRIIDYMADPNFPRELKGADLTNYPFYISVPEKIDFECKGRHDGYYTNIDLHCQIYHHCAVGNRYDFLCPNYTLFDQTTFTCRFINTVDCVGSAKHFDRNNALYVEKDEHSKDSSSSSTTTSTTTTTTTSTTQTPRLNIQLSQRNSAGRAQAQTSAFLPNWLPSFDGLIDFYRNR